MIKPLKMSKKEIISKVNEFRDFARNAETYPMAHNVMSELAWMIDQSFCDVLSQGWRSVSGQQLDSACNQVIDLVYNQ